MTAEDIHDSDSLQAWLTARPVDRRQADAIAIAQRAALRALPFFLLFVYEPSWGRRGLAAIPVYRSLLTSGVARVFGTLDVSAAYAAAAANTASNAAASHDAYAAVNAANAAYAASYAAVYASDAVASAVDAAGATANAIANAANDNASTFWQAVREDASALEAKLDPISQPLWPGEIPPELLKAEAEGLERLATETGDRNSFWHRWWFAMKRGEPMDWALQRDVALIPEEIWKQGARAVGVEIAKIEARYKRPSPPADVLDLAHTDFTYDALRQWMRMVPFEQDISRLRDPVVLGRLQDASDDLRTVLETLQTAAEAAGRQSANEVKAIAGPIFKELDRVTSHQELRVGVLIDLGETLQFASGNEDIRMGLGPILPRLMDRASDRLLDLLRAYFAPSMVRTAPLREIVLQADESPRAIVEMARKTLAILQDYDGSVIPPLNPEDLEVLQHLNDALARAWLLFEAANSTEIKVELGNSFARKAFQLAVDKARYVKRGYDQVNAAIGGKDNDTADAMLRRIQLFHTATEIGQWLLELLKLMTGS
jgi:hypothetical protein